MNTGSKGRKLKPKESSRYHPSAGMGRLEATMGRVIHDLRITLGLTGAELCRRSGGLDPRTLTAIEKGRIRNPSLKSFEQISKGLGCLVKDLFAAAELEIRENFQVGSQKGHCAIDLRKQGITLVSATPLVPELFCGKLLLGPRRHFDSRDLRHTGPVFFEVVMGRIEFQVERQKGNLREGENLYLRGSLQYALLNLSGREAVLWMVATPSLFTGAIKPA